MKNFPRGKSGCGYNPEDVTSVWVVENGAYVEFMLIESRFQGKDLIEVQEIQSSQKDIVKSEMRNNLQAQIDLTQHIETIVGSVNTHKDVHMKNIRNTRKKEQKRCHQDYMKEGRNYGLHISVRKPGRNSARFFGTL